MKEDRPRTAVEIAMERLRERDAEQGTAELPPTESQKAAIAEARQIRASKVAQLEILHRSALARTFDPAERERLHSDYHRELQRSNEDCERKIHEIREKLDKGDRPKLPR